MKENTRRKMQKLDLQKIRLQIDAVDKQLATI